MTRSSRSFPTPHRQSQPRLTKRSWIEALAIGTTAAVLATGCVGRNLHRELRDDPGILVREWTLPTHGPFEAGDRGTEFSNPVMLENTLIFGNQSIGLVSLYPGILQTHWALPIRGGIVSELAVDRGTVYFGGADGFLYAVNAENGRVTWRYDLHNPVISRPTLDGGRVFVTTSDDTVYAFDAGTGKWLWHYRRRTSPLATIHGASSPLVDAGEVLVGLSDGFLVSLGAQDGQLKWERKLHQGTRFTDVDSHPILEKGVLYVPSYDGALYALKRQGGETLWRFDAGGSKQVVIDDQKLYLPSSDGSIYCLQKSNAKLLWKFELDGGAPTQLILTNRYVLFGSSHQYLYSVDRETGKGMYRFNAGYGSGFTGAPTFDPTNQRLYALSGAGNLYAFTLRTDRPKVFAHGSTDPYDFK